MKYEKIPTEDYDDDAQELSVELATNVDSDEERDIDINEEGSSSTNTPGVILSDNNKVGDAAPRKKGKFPPRNHSQSPLGVKKKRSKWVRHLHVFLFLLFTAVVVFTFLPSAVKKMIVWRHKKVYGGSCHDKDNSSGSEDINAESRSDKKTTNLLEDPSISYNPSTPYIQLSTLPSEYIPTPAEQKPQKHLIFIGDIHGMFDEFQELLKRLESKGFLDRAHIVLTGDFISKGPDSVPLLDALIAMNVSCVRGNHEDELMRVYWKLQKKAAGIESQEESDIEVKEIEGASSGSGSDHETEKPLGKRDDDKDKDDDDKDKDDDDKDKEHEHAEGHKKHKNKGKKKHKHRNKHRKKYKHSDIKLAKSLKPHHADFIDACPLILKLENVSNIGDIAVVHAGMMPGVELEHQKPSVVMNVRTFVKKKPTAGRKGLHWSKMWNEFMTRGPNRQKPLTVVYGHDARRGLDIKKYTKGLDTNCVRGGKLTALVVEGGKHGKTSIVNVKCRKYLD
ncbi:hypothetical protein TWF730_006576 [Orbilia blumenaviensis]|uniref:Calcineurin-like phosphoesterase domain-containing protein n=1 Tax=Orbilia blumenaviensis TaxID=1796055 RepID=A0AAV9VFU7_9PEZI